MERTDYYFKAIYVGEEFPDEHGNLVLVADDLKEVGYCLCFVGIGYEDRNFHDDDITDYEDLEQPCENLSDYMKIRNN